MKIEVIFPLYQRLKCLARVAVLDYIHTRKIEGFESILFAYHYKSVDTSDGIIQLYKHNLPECSQALFRVLFETYIKHDELLIVAREQGKSKALELALDSMMLMANKRVNTQEKYVEFQNRPNIKNIEQKYSRETINKIKRYGFSKIPIDQLAKKHNKDHIYQMLYRNFSRNIHADDAQEYILKFSENEWKDHIIQRDEVAISEAFKISMEMVLRMNKAFEMKLDTELESIQKEYSMHLNEL